MRGERRKGGHRPFYYWATGGRRGMRLQKRKARLPLVRPGHWTTWPRLPTLDCTAALLERSLLPMQRRERCWFDPWVGKAPWRRAWQPTPVFSPGDRHGQRSLAGYSAWGRKGSDTTEPLSLQASAGTLDAGGRSADQRTPARPSPTFPSSLPPGCRAVLHFLDPSALCEVT